jgi:cell division septum initiation protein DivIVA
MTDLPPPPELDPTALTGTEFAKGRRGYEPTEVRSALGRAADALRTWADRDARLEARISELETRLAAAEQLDEAHLTAVLGEETVRVIAAARSAAAEIRSKAAEDAERLVREAERSAAATAAALTAEATAAREEAERERTAALEESARVRAEAADEATRVRQEATAAATALREEAAGEAERLRSEAAEEASRLRDDAHARHDELIAQAGAVLEERTAEAEAAAAGIREVAEAELAAAREQALAAMDEARVTAAEEVERARSEGRDMVAEARELRERMLRDLAERRRTARRQIEAARAGRDRIAEALRVLGREIDGELTQLADSEAAARRAGDAAAAAVVDDVDLVVADLHQQMSAAPVDLDDVAGPATEDERRATGEERSPREATVDATGDDTSGDDASRDDASGDDGAAEHGAGDDGAADHGAEVDTGVAASGEGAVEAAGTGEEPAVEGSAVDPDDDASATVHDLFERIRAERAAAARQAEELGLDPEDLLDDDHPDDEDLLEDEGHGVGEPAAAAGGQADGAPNGGSRRGGRSGTGVAEVITLDPAGRGAPAAGAGAEPVVAEAAAGVQVLDPAQVEVAQVEVDVREGAVPAEVHAAADAPADVPDEAAGEAAEETPADGLGALLDRRDELLGSVERSLARVLKRLASDEQNEVLDRLRRVKRGRVDLADLLPEADVERWSEALAPDLRTASEAGRELWAEQTGSTVGPTPSDDDLSDALRPRVEELLGNRRAHLQRVVDDADAAGLEPAELADHLRAAYREWRSTALGELAGDLATAGFAHGTRAAAGSGARWCWVPDHGGLPCADAEDNALAGPVACGEPFPTGDVLPPAHPGCRCLLAPAPQ